LPGFGAQGRGRDSGLVGVAERGGDEAGCEKRGGGDAGLNRLILLAVLPSVTGRANPVGEGVAELGAGGDFDAQGIASARPFSRTRTPDSDPERALLH